MNEKILIVDDDEKINELLNDIFEMENFLTVPAFNGQEALNILENDDEISIMILDAMMPVLDGWDILKYVKEKYDIKVIMLTALGSEKDEVRGFQEGADDYIVKPFSRAILVERVKRLCQDVRKEKNTDLKFKNMIVSKHKMCVTIDGEKVEMTNKEFNLLVLLMMNCNSVLSREIIAEKIWGFENDIEYRNIDTQIKMLRHSLGDYGMYIKTVRGVGYLFDGNINTSVN